MIQAVSFSAKGVDHSHTYICHFFNGSALSSLINVALSTNITHG